MKPGLSTHKKKKLRWRLWDKGKKTELDAQFGKDADGYQRLSRGRRLLCITFRRDVVSFSKQIVCCGFLRCVTVRKKGHI